MIDAPTHALRVMILRTIFIGSTFGFAAIGVVGDFTSDVVRPILLVASAFSAAMAVAKFVLPKLPDALIRSFLVFLAVVVFITALTIQPFQNVSTLILVGGIVAVCSFESLSVAIAQSVLMMALGAISIIVRSSIPIAASVIFVFVCLLCVISVLGFRRVSTVAIADAMRDPLTGLTNRRGMQVALPLLSGIAHREDYLVGCLSIDLDHFKRINDTFGHPFGDKILIRTARILESRVREADLLVRLGGEEFALFALVASEKELQVLGEALRSAVEAVDDPPVTVSIGGAMSTVDDSTAIDDMIARADAAMYSAKRSGRNRVVIG
jgi:diguanylate cyclase (GGDEF)-like protein